jgi:hypothetical protein
MINRSFLSLLFAFLLTFAQQQALLHPYEHTADLQQKSSNQKNTLPHSDSCSKCIALAGIASAVGSKSQLFHALSTTFEFLPSTTQPIISAHFQPYQSRAPPYLA